MSKSCIETIKIEDGQIFNIEGHNRRCNRTRRMLYGTTEDIDLAKHLKNPPQEGLFRCRISYQQEILAVEYFPYQAKTFKTFKIIESDIDYSHKYADRSQLNQLKEQASNYDEIIIVKKGFLTDISIANIAFYDGSSWLTPQKPLLAGTMREKLIKNHKLITKAIKSIDLRHFSHFALMNAMIGFEIQKNPTIL